jgi:signal transduction histidine kinase
LNDSTADRDRTLAARDQFLRILSHELRTPVSVGLVWANLLRERRVPQERMDEAFAAIEESFRQQKRIVDLLGDAARISSGRIELCRAPADVATLARESLSLVAAAAERRGVTLVDDIQVSAEADLDADRFHQIMSHLLANAVRHATRNALGGDRPAGHVTVSTACEGDCILIRIVDDGSGIPGELLAHLFEPSMHAARAAALADAASSGELEPELAQALRMASGNGLGLGLALARRLAELHGGTITAASEGLGRGATLCVSFPCRQATDATNS